MTGRAGRPDTGQETVAVVYNLGGADPFDIVAAAAGTCELLVLIDADSPTAARAAIVFEELGVECLVAAATDPEVARTLAEQNIAGIVTFSELELSRTAELGRALGLPVHSSQTIQHLTDKSAQRRRLHASGVDSVQYLVASDTAGIAFALQSLGTPAVLKPLVGVASRDVHLIQDIEHWEALQPALPAGEKWLVEEYLAGDRTCAGEAWGDYVSVEIASSGGVHTCLGVVGKFPLAAPFRESGMLFPATLSSPDQSRVRRLASDAVSALGVVDGVSHTEIKLTPRGPRIIEVNGRVGGYVGDILRRAGGSDPVRTALLIALGRPVTVAEPSTASGAVTFQRFLTTPPHEVRIAEIAGAQQVRELPGIERVVVTARPGDVLDPRHGTQAYVGIVTGRADSHRHLSDIATAISGLLTVKYA